jgi:hypothetical protein
MSVLCDTTVRDNWRILTTPVDVSTVRGCLKAADNDGKAFDMTFDLNTKQCITYGLTGSGIIATTKTSPNVVFVYFDAYVDGCISLAK